MFTKWSTSRTIKYKIKLELCDMIYVIIIRLYVYTYE